MNAVERCLANNGWVCEEVLFAILSRYCKDPKGAINLSCSRPELDYEYEEFEYVNEFGRLKIRRLFSPKFVNIAKNEAKDLAPGSLAHCPSLVMPPKCPTLDDLDGLEDGGYN